MTQVGINPLTEHRSLYAVYVPNQVHKMAHPVSFCWGQHCIMSRSIDGINDVDHILITLTIDHTEQGICIDPIQFKSELVHHGVRHWVIH